MLWPVPGAGVPRKRLIAGAVVVVLLLIAAIIGHAVASGSSIAVGDCVITTPSAVSGWDIKKVACDSNPGSALMIQKVVSVQGGANGECTGLPGCHVPRFRMSYSTIAVTAARDS